MQKIKTTPLLKQGSKLNLMIYLIISSLYAASLVYTVMGVVYLMIILLSGDIVVVNGQFFALGILLFFPLRYMKREWKRRTDL